MDGNERGEIVKLAHQGLNILAAVGVVGMAGIVRYCSNEQQRIQKLQPTQVELFSRRNMNIKNTDKK